MRCRAGIFAIVLLAAALTADAGPPSSAPTTRPAATARKARIIFLHHSTGECIWNGGVAAWFDAYNQQHHSDYRIVERAFPKDSPYGWNNYPYDYWNIWVRHAGDKPYMSEPTLEMLTRDYDVIVFKHCFPVSSVEPDAGSPDVASEEKRIENYRLQYDAIRKKLHTFPKTNFIVWTGAALLASETDAASAKRAQTFFDWIRDAWDVPGDNIFVWDFRRLETEGGLYLKPAFASGDSHPNESFSKRVAPLLGGRIVDVIEGRGDNSPTVGRDVGLQGKDAQKEIVQREPGNEAAQIQPQVARGAVERLTNRWVFDDAETAGRQRERWGNAVTYTEEGEKHCIAIDFAKGAEEDWGEYGVQRVVSTNCPNKNEDISGFDRIRFRARSDRAMELVVTLITRPDSIPRNDPSYFGFTGYIQLEPGTWRDIDLALPTLELGMEGDKAYNAAGKPARPMELSEIRFVTNKKNESTKLMLDDIEFVGGRRSR